MQYEVDSLFWILESVYATKMPLKIAANRASYEACMNRIHHRLDHADFVSQLVKMTKEGFIRIERGAKRGGDLTEVAVSESDLLRHLGSDSEVCFCYSLTAKGGDFFETLSFPNWDRFVSQRWFQRNDNEAIALESRCGEFLNEYCKNVTIVPFGTVARKVSEKIIAPFKALYWKTFSSGMQICFDVVEESLTFEHLNALRTRDDVKRDQEFTRWRRFGYSRRESEMDFTAK